MLWFLLGLEDYKMKRGLEASFSWIFAIAVGAVIIFLAIWASNEFIQTERTVRDTEIGKEIGILLSPVETGIESGKTSKIILAEETRLFNTCRTEGNFGRQSLSVATRSGLGEEFQSPGFETSFFNKYVFSQSVVRGEEYLVFSKPFYYPYKIADIILILGEESYCFIDTPYGIEQEISDLNIEEVSLVGDITECPNLEEEIKVCFASSNCDIDVNLNSKSVKNNIAGVTSYYALGEGDSENSLLYGAIFSSPGVYECQVKRLMKRASQLAFLYNSKSEFLTAKGCGSSLLQKDLFSFGNATANFEESIDFRKISNIEKEVLRKNEDLNCKLF
jgi:hypothetical protein